MTKPRIAFVASGGAVKGVAHIGVQKAMEELGLEADVYVGASVGAITGAFFAQGYAPEQLIDWLRPFWGREDPESALKLRYFAGLPNKEQMRSLGYLSSGLFSLDRFERFLAETLPVNDFAKLNKKLLVSAADVDGRGRFVFGKGHEERVSISQAVAASCAVPLVFRPVKIGSRYFVDGEVVRTLSLDLAVEAGADIIIVSNVYRPHVLSSGAKSLVFDGPLAMGRQMLNVLLSEKERRGMDLFGRLYPHVTLLNVSADLGRFPFVDRGVARELLQRGYREALKVLTQAKREGVFERGYAIRPVGNA